MTVINTNVGALMARTYATKANDKHANIHGAAIFWLAH